MGIIIGLFHFFSGSGGGGVWETIIPLLFEGEILIVIIRIIIIIVSIRIMTRLMIIRGGAGSISILWKR